MKSIGEILGELSSADRAKLQYAFDHEMQQYIAIDGGTRFVGVNCSSIPILKVEHTAGFWSTGSIDGAYQESK